MELSDLWVEDEVLGARKTAHANLKKVYRVKVTDWIFQVAAVYGLSQATVHHALDIYNRYHQGLPAPIPKDKLQIQVCAALVIAHKYRDRDHITPSDLEDLSCGNCSAEQIIEEETRILLALDFDLRFASPHEWLHVFIASPAIQEEFHSVSNILLGQILLAIDVAVHCEDHLNFTCATVTAAAIQCVTGVDPSAFCQGPCAAALQACTQWLSKFMPLVEVKAAPVPKEAFLEKPEDIQYKYVCCLEEIIKLECPDEV